MRVFVSVFLHLSLKLVHLLKVLCLPWTHCIRGREGEEGRRKEEVKKCIRGREEEGGGKKVHQREGGGGREEEGGKKMHQREGGRKEEEKNGGKRR
jgi:hypothetical protein